MLCVTRPIIQLHLPSTCVYLEGMKELDGSRKLEHGIDRSKISQGFRIWKEASHSNERISNIKHGM
jgi:hypothetical protein